MLDLFSSLLSVLAPPAADGTSAAAEVLFGISSGGIIGGMPGGLIGTPGEMLPPLPPSFTSFGAEAIASSSREGAPP